MTNSAKATNTLRCYRRSTIVKDKNADLVNELKWNGRTIAECEACGSCYGDLETAERCEQYCNLHGRPSPTLTQKAIRKPIFKVSSIVASPAKLPAKFEQSAHTVMHE